MMSCKMWKGWEEENKFVANVKYFDSLFIKVKY